MMAIRSPASEEGMHGSKKAASSSTSMRRSKTEFPVKLYAMLELADNIPVFARAVTWLPHGRAFRVLDEDTFMEEVVPVFFNQTKIRSFNRQLHLWGFHRIGRGNEKVWFNDNFLRGVPASMEHLVRTKIKGNIVGSIDDGKIPNFDALPSLPICDKHPSDVLNEMEKAILKIQNSSIAHRDLTMSSLSHASFNDVTDHPTVSLGSESSCDFSVDVDPDEPFMSPPSLLPAVSNGSQGQGVPFMRCHLPLQASTSESMTYTNETSVEGSSHQAQSHVMLQADFNDLCFSPLKHSNDDFEPLPFWVDNDSCVSDEFANFIGHAIQNVDFEG
ncbi:heat shock factor family protein [Skeletonema marinoi]|uniref:Heat shock factor family protein n=1 Tax=Skeletonema marinoi TaxID=267567 RepID=A0AAD9DFD9_9STRA|nr:heat shock factor family protein [Skeletonema marinoi]